jgi:putative FmdB family regulatory protein
MADKPGGLRTLPTYEYRCVSCEHQFERFQRMSDDPVKECEVCGEPVKRLLFPVAIQFKGKGFYTTDYARRSTLGHAGPHAGNGGGSDLSTGSESNGSADTAKSSASESSTSVPAAATANSD